MTNKQIILACYGYLNAQSVAKICDVQRGYVYQLWKFCDLPILKDINMHVPKRKLK